jgi:hypothetical protein
MTNMFEKLNSLLIIFKSKYVKIFPFSYNEKLANRQRTNTEYNYDDYKELLEDEFCRKMKSKNNKNKKSVLRIRSISF